MSPELWPGCVELRTECHSFLMDGPRLQGALLQGTKRSRGGDRSVIVKGIIKLRGLRKDFIRWYLKWYLKTVLKEKLGVLSWRRVGMDMAHKRNKLLVAWEQEAERWAFWFTHLEVAVNSKDSGDQNVSQEMDLSRSASLSSTPVSYSCSWECYSLPYLPSVVEGGVRTERLSSWLIFLYCGTFG